jgi:hypothetical protein
MKEFMSHFKGQSLASGAGRRQAPGPHGHTVGPSFKQPFSSWRKAMHRAHALWLGPFAGGPHAALAEAEVASVGTLDCGKRRALAKVESQQWRVCFRGRRPTCSP